MEAAAVAAPTARTSSHSLRFVVACVGLASVAWLVFLAVGIVRYGSFGAFKAYLNGQRLWSDVREIDLGGLKAGERRVVQWPIRNPKSHPVRIMGVQTSCHCAVVETLPKTLAPNENTRLEVTVNVESGRKPGAWEQSLSLFEDGGLRTVSVRMSGNVGSP